MGLSEMPRSSPLLAPSALEHRLIDENATTLATKRWVKSLCEERGLLYHGVSHPRVALVAPKEVAEIPTSVLR